MTDIMDISDSSSNSQMMDSSYPVKCALNEAPAADDTTHFISIDSNTTLGSAGTTASFMLSEAGHQTDFFENYDIYPTILGTGGYGCVRECLHRDTGEKYAVKTIDKSKVTRFDHIRREIELLRSIEHHNIMKMVDYYEDVDYVHIVTEIYTGGELFDEIINNTTDDGCLDEDQAAKIIKSILEAVQYLHDNDIVHRDIKPENILFEDAEGSSIKLIDFGLSRKHGVNDTPMTTQVGTSYYMSPDVFQGKYDRSCDLWSVGVVAYVLLCGYPPFGGETNEEIRESILNGNLEFEDKIWGSLTKASRDFVSKLLRIDLTRISAVEKALQHPWIVNS